MMTEETIKQAQAPDTFDVFSFLEGTAYPTKEVTVYQDAKSATELVDMNKKRLDFDAIPKESRPELTIDFDAEIERLSNKVRASALTFELRGMPPGMVRELYNIDEDATQETVLHAENLLIANTIVGVRTATGARDASVWTDTDVVKLRRFLKEGEFAKIVTGVTEVNFNAVVFDQAVDAGFLSRGSDLAS